MLSAIHVVMDCALHGPRIKPEPDSSPAVSFDFRKVGTTYLTTSSGFEFTPPHNREDKLKNLFLEQPVALWH